jgi:uncharacterized membrane protein
MPKRSNLVGGMVIGAGLMYLLDPDRGRRRRAMVRDQMVSSWNELDNVVDTAGRDLKNRARGVLAETRSRFRSDEVDDDVLLARVRSEIGRAVSHPHAVRVQSEAGCVTLSGPVLADEEEGLIATVKGVRGVEGVVNHLEPHQEAGTVSGLQGAGRKPGARSEVMQENWAPAIRVLMGLGGGLTTLYGRRVRGPVGSMISMVGLGVLARAATNLRINRLTGVGAGRRAVQVQKMINVNAPVEEVFEFWSHFENFPRFMSKLREARRTGDGNWHFVAEGPAGTTFEWDAIITRVVPNDCIAWKSVEGATVANAGIVKFQPNEKGGTRVDIRLSYNPPGGAIGHAVASFFGFDPKSSMDEDLVRFKSLIEEGKTSAHGQTVRREDLGAFPAGFEPEERFGGGAYGGGAQAGESTRH